MKKIIIYSLIAVSLSFSCKPKQSSEQLSIPVPVKLEDIIIKGELEKRISKNFDRLEDEKYQPDNVFLTNEESNWWPGDTEGRTLLGLVLDAQALKREPKYLKEIMRLFPEKMNEKGYFGDIHPDTVFDEQQLSSHGWVLRGLCEHYQWTKDEKTLAMIEKMVENLALPTLGYHESTYPIDPTKREHAGSFSGNRHSKMYNNWILSTDIGCDFIFLDGVVHAYEILRTEKLRVLIDEMIGVFTKIDLFAIKAQTHATLTALRAIGRYYEITQDPELLKIIKDRYKLYVTQGMTENYENYNWFQRPRWTEPCAIIDSYINAVNLWKYTGDEKYLEDAHHILYNGIYVTQRKNGGFGCNTCSGAKDPFLGVSTSESYWCCTMRGGEGLSRAAEYQYFTFSDTIIIPFFNDNEATIRFGNEHIKISETTGYPYSGVVDLKIIENTLSFKPIIKLIAPKYSDNQNIKLNDQELKFELVNGFVIIESELSANDVISYNFDLKTQVIPTHNKHSINDYFTFHYGPLILSNPSKDEVVLKSKEITKLDDNQFKVGDLTLKPLHHIMDTVWWEKGYKQQVMFKTN